jgi:arginine decarboxylase
MDKFRVEDAMNIYGIDAWGVRYFSVSEDGFLCVHPTADANQSVNVFKTVQELQKTRIQTPVILRFPQILADRVQGLCKSFADAITEFNYQSSYHPVFPIKVNQQEGVVDALLEAGYKYDLGIEVGSKPELVAALGKNTPANSLTICNGFKDQAYFELASLGASMGKNVVVVIEKAFELKELLRLKESGKEIPLIGFRIKLHSKGSGLWEKSGGHASKFGLSPVQIIDSVRWLEANGLSQYLKLLHFHIGSQIPEIRKIKAAIKEAARIYAKVKKMGCGIEYLDVGGGLGVDYDGSGTSSDASVNYTLKEYANDVVYTIAEVCDNERVPHPKIVSESGRALVTHHAMLVVDVRDHVKEADENYKVPFKARETQVVEELQYIFKNVSVKNYREFYHDAVERREELYSLFNLGMIDMEDLAKGEWLYWSVAKKTVKYSKSAKFVSDEFVELEQKLYEKVVCNFSVFQSIPDHWALDQLFPIVPIHRLNEKPQSRATLVDITCDSDGQVDKFVDLKDIKPALEVHDCIENEPYYLAFLLIGSYQDTMGDMHNLFGAVHDVQIFMDETGKPHIKTVKKGDTIAQTVEMFGYDRVKLIQEVKNILKDRVTENKLTQESASKLAEEYTKKFQQYPYLT